MKLEKHKLCPDNVFLCHNKNHLNITFLCRNIFFSMSQQRTDQVLIDLKNICRDTIFLCCNIIKKGINTRLVFVATFNEGTTNF